MAVVVISRGEKEIFVKADVDTDNKLIIEDWRHEDGLDMELTLHERCQVRNQIEAGIDLTGRGWEGTDG